MRNAQIIDLDTYRSRRAPAAEAPTPAAYTVPPVFAAMPIVWVPVWWVPVSPIVGQT